MVIFCILLLIQLVLYSLVSISVRDCLERLVSKVIYYVSNGTFHSQINIKFAAVFVYRK